MQYILYNHKANQIGNTKKYFGAIKVGAHFTAVTGRDIAIKDFTHESLPLFNATFTGLT